MLRPNPAAAGLVGDEVVTETLVRDVFLSLQKQIAGVHEMVRHEPLGQCGVSLLNRVEDGFMEVEGVLEIDKLRGHRDHLEHFSMNDVEEPPAEPVSRRLEDSPMEEQI